MALHAASLTKFGAGILGKPWPKFTAPYSMAKGVKMAQTSFSSNPDALSAIAFGIVVDVILWKYVR